MEEEDEDVFSAFASSGIESRRGERERIGGFSTFSLFDFDLDFRVDNGNGNVCGTIVAICVIIGDEGMIIGV